MRNTQILTLFDAALLCFSSFKIKSKNFVEILEYSEQDTLKGEPQATRPNGFTEMGKFSFILNLGNISCWSCVV